MKQLPLPMRRAAGPRAAAAGFTLVEMMIAITLGLIILAALTTFFVQSSANRAEMERGARQIENGRYAMNALREDIAMAGFYYDIAQTGATWRGLVTEGGLPPVPACVTAVGSLGFSNSPLQLPLPIFGYANGTGVPACVTNLVAGTDVLVIRRFNTEPATVATAEAAQFYIQVSHCRTDSTGAPFVTAAGSSAASFILREVDCAALAKLWRYREHVYYIRNFSTTAGDGIPTLVRLELDGGVTRTVPLVEGIQVMRLEYFLDTNGDGSPDAWRRCDPATSCTTAQWTTVTGIRPYLLSANTEASPGYADTKTYDLGAVGTVGPFGDAFKRHLYTAVVNATNRSGLLER